MDVVSNSSRRRSKRPIRELILEALKDGEKTGRELLEISLKAGYDRNTHYYHLRKLIDEGIVEVEKINRRENKYRLKTKERVLRPLSDSDIALLKEVAELGEVDITLRFIVKLLASKSGALNNEYFRNILIDTLKKFPSISPDKVDNIRSIVEAIPNVIFDNDPDENLLKDLEKVSKDLISYVTKELRKLEEKGDIRFEGSTIKYSPQNPAFMKKLVLLSRNAADVLFRIYKEKNDLGILKYLLRTSFETKLYFFDHKFKDLVREAIRDNRSKELIKEECLRRLRENLDEPTRSIAVSILETLLEV